MLRSFSAVFKPGSYLIVDVFVAADRRQHAPGFIAWAKDFHQAVRAIAKRNGSEADRPAPPAFR